ncbi:nickel/cobalt transporter [Minwuia sp.]|uniref:nickel/cobalt transporter n=1 Tax=Minwuia sp. TaxID=2493630 RepID=UPI003A8FC4D2
MRWLSRLGLVLFLTLTCLAVQPADAQSPNPFQRGPVQTEPQGEPGFFDWLMNEVRVVQAQLYRQLAGAVKALKQDYSIGTAWALIAISLLYGVFHAVGPGHGKAVISSYLLANERAVKQGILLAVLSSLAQGISAVVLVFGGAWVAGLAGQRLMDAAWSMEQLSFGLIALIGLFLLWQVLTGRGHHHHEAHDHDHDHAHDDHDHHHHHHGPDVSALVAEPLTVRRALPIIFAVGIRPCGGALIVLVFAIANSLYMAGIIATFAMSMGTAATVSVLAVLTLVSKNTAMRLAGRDLVWVGRVEKGLKVFGALALIAFGLLFLLASLEQPRAPFGV